MQAGKGKAKMPASDEGEGDLGLQGLHLETTPPRTSSSSNGSRQPLSSPPFGSGGGHTLQVIMSRFGSQHSAKLSNSSLGSSYFSARDGGADSSSMVATPPGINTTTTTTKVGERGGKIAQEPRPKTSRSSSSYDSPPSSSQSHKGRYRLPRLRSDASDSMPTSRRMSSGSSSKAKDNVKARRNSEVPPKPSERISSARATNKTSSPGLISEGKQRLSGTLEGTVRGTSASSTKAGLQPQTTLTGGTSSTGLVLTGAERVKVASSNPTSPTLPSSSMTFPGRRASLISEKKDTKKAPIDKTEPISQSFRIIPSGSSDKTVGQNLSHASERKSMELGLELGLVSQLQRWVLSIGCVNFDLDKGPDLEFLYPSLGISREERDNIAFSSFPDTSIFDDGQAVFSWRVREVPLDSSGSVAPVIASQTRGEISTSTERSSTMLTSSSSQSRSNASLSNPSKTWTFERGRMQQSRLDSGSLDSSSTGHANGGELKSRSLPSRKEESSSSSPAVYASSGSDYPLQRHASNTSSSSSAVEEGLSQASTAATSGEGASSLLVEEISSTGTEATFLPSGGGSRSSNFIHGYCFFRQKRDASIRRGYFQKSIVILSHLPYVSLFSDIVRKLGPLFFEKGMPALEAFVQDVQNWPPPEPGARLHLPLMGTVLSVDLPNHSQFQTSLAAEARIVRNLNAPGKARSGLYVKPDSGPRGSEDEPLLASIPSTPLFDIFRECIDDLWLLWECLLLADPILVVGPDPCICSEAVWHMLDLVRPIPFAGDFRPFFTIHDYDFKTLVTKNKPIAGVILGVTNPFMLQACKHWPNVLKVGKGFTKAAKYGSVGRSKAANGAGGLPSSAASSAGGGGAATSTTGGIAGGNHAGGGGPEHVPGLLSKRKRRISKDRPLLRKLHEMAEKGTDDEAANAMLRRYFSDLTERFLAPLNRYIVSLIPADFDLSSPTETPRIKPFNTTAFLASLKMHGTPLPIRSRNLPTGATVRQSLYTEFLQCPNFSLWLHERIAQSEEELYNRKLQALELGDINDYVKRKGELETIDLYSRLMIEIRHIDDKLVACKRERELEPNSRWKSSGTSAASTSSKKTVASSSSSLRESSPAFALSAEPFDTITAGKIEELVRTSGNLLTSGERSLLVKKVHLIRQLDTLVRMLPPDLRHSVQLKQTQKKPLTSSRK